MPAPDRERRPRAVVLLSGGVDSATTLALAVERGFETHALTVHYGQRHAIEVDRARTLAPRLGATSHRTVTLDLSYLAGSALTDAATAVPQNRTGDRIGAEIPTTYVPARNTLFLALALGWGEVLEAHDLFIGVNAVDYSGYPDCRPEFLRAFEHLALLATKAGVEGAGFRVHAPLVDWTKARIILEAQRLQVDLGATLSCYDPGPRGEICGRCDSCLLREKGFREAGLRDPACPDPQSC
jgi:7-cyano-7-deazaguanine synthase